MSHGAALREAWGRLDLSVVKPGDEVQFFQMSLPCNGGRGPGPHRATVVEVCGRSLHLRVNWGNKMRGTDERFVEHRGMADNGRFWDFKP